MSAGLALRSFRVAKSPATIHIERDSPNTTNRLVALMYVCMAAISRVNIYRTSAKSVPGIKPKTESIKRVDSPQRRK